MRTGLEHASGVRHVECKITRSYDSGDPRIDRRAWPLLSAYPHRFFGERDIMPCMSWADRDAANIDAIGVRRALAAPYRRQREPDRRIRHRVWVPARGHWLRVVTEADGETVHNAFWDGDFEP